MNFRQRALKPSWPLFEEITTDQEKGVEKPDYCKAYNKDEVIFLPTEETFDFKYLDTFEAICKRKSTRKYRKESLSLNQLSYLLLTTQGILNTEKPMLRTVPSAGARHAIETYIYCENVEGLNGLYRYIPLEHGLVFIHDHDIYQLDDIKFFTFNAPCTFFWTAVPYRMSWRYAHASEKLILLDAGHVCQNLYLAAEAIGLGACAVGAYDQDPLDEFLDVDGENEFLIYGSPVGYKG